MQIDLNQAHSRLNHYIETYISQNRRQAVLDMYEDLGDRLYLSPASSVESYHNAFPGGYIDHILRVTDFSREVYTLYKNLGLNVSDFTEEHLIFTALHHDLGKLGFPGSDNECYIVNDSEWHRNKLGQVYKYNVQNPFMLIQDQSLYLLQFYGIPLDWVEYITIKTHDGLYDDTNKPYLISRTDDAKLRSNLPHIIHTADFMAAKFEYERWSAGKKSHAVPAVSKKQTSSASASSKGSDTAEFNKAFDALFGNTANK